MHFEYSSLREEAYAVLTKQQHVLRTLAVPGFFHATFMSPDPTSLQQHQKVGKKRRSPARLLLRLLTKLSRPLLVVPDGEKLNWLSRAASACQLTYRIYLITGEP
jgi:hypothetical protein